MSFAFTAKIQDQEIPVTGKGSIDGNSIRGTINAMGQRREFQRYAHTKMMKTRLEFRLQTAIWIEPILKSRNSKRFSEEFTMKRHSAILLTALIAALAAVAQAQNKGEVLIKNATIMTASHGMIEGGSILIRDGKIAAVGKNGEVRAGPNAKVIDATGMYVTPGIIDAHSHSALRLGQRRHRFGFGDGADEGRASTRRDINIYRQLAGGTTTITPCTAAPTRSAART